MLYKLLRDNIETGPYTKSELMGMNLLSSDFIRPDVEGSNWILANKFTELKDKIVENAPKPKYKITADGKLVEITTTPAAGNSESNASHAADNVPFKRTPSALPKKKIETEENKDKPFDYQPAKETAPALSKTTTATFAGTKNEPVKPKQKKEKKKTGNVLKEFIIPLAILGGLFAGWSIYNSQTGNGSKETRETLNTMLSDFGKDTLKAENTTEPATTATPATNVSVPAFDSTAKTAATSYAEKKKTDSAAITKKAAAYKDSVAPAAKKTSQLQEQKPVEKTAAAETKPKEQATAAKPPAAPKEEPSKTATATPAPAKEKPKSAATKKDGSVRDYVRLDLNKPSKEFVNAKIRVNNISKTNLNIAMVRVRYLDEKSNVLKSETLQVENIPAGRSVIVGIPDNKSAAKISYGVTMISGDDVYIMRK